MAASAAAVGDGDIEIIDLVSSPPASAVDKTPNGKRKGQSDGDSVPAGKKARKEGLVEIKGKKVILRQEPYQRFIPRRRLLNFEGWLLDAEEAGAKPITIPDEFYDVIAMAGHELTSGSEATFIKSLRGELVKGPGDALTNELLAPLVSKLFTLKQYGFLPSDFGVAPSRFPAGLQIRCWEASDIDQYFPADRIPDVRARQAEREQARKYCETLLASMDDLEKADLLKGEYKQDGPRMAASSVPPSVPPSVASAAPSPIPGPSMPRSSREGTAASESSRRSASPSKQARKKLTPEEEEAKRKRKEEAEAKREEREAKKAEREEKKKEQEAQKEAKRVEEEEKKAAKEREEEKKQQTKAKQAKMFGAFFKPKPTTTKQEPEAGPSNSEPTESDYHRSFKPPVQRANVEWAPINRWSSSNKGKAAMTQDVASWMPKDFVADHLRLHNRTRSHRRRRGIKVGPTHGTVAYMMAAYQASEDPRSVLEKLKDNDKFPWKTLAFDKQLRPPYSGTWTKPSLVVGPRTPFAQDPVFDYSYDSGDDWQEDEGGDDVDAPEEEVVEPEVDSDEDEGEFDDWLDDEEDPIFAQEPDGDVPMVSSSPVRASPAKPVKKKLVPKRVTKLTPYWRGPVWEETIAEPVDGLEGYRIQLLNDTPDSIDPFTYQSSDPVQHFQPKYTSMAVGAQLGVNCLLAADSKPAPAPPRAAPMPLGDASSSTNVAKPRRIQAKTPKVAFPSKHVPELLRLVDGNTKILSDLISSLKVRFDKVASKAAIEAKVREVATREGKSKDSIWKVKAEAWVAAGVSPPVRGIAALTSGGV